MPKGAFISHNQANKDLARLLGTKLVEQGQDVWFDEWKLRPGDSITGGIEAGIADAAVFVLIWSEHAKKSNWVNAELRAMLVRRIADAGLRIVPVMVDDTPLPLLVADYKGFKLQRARDLDQVAREIAGQGPALDQIGLIQKRLLTLVVEEFPASDAIRSMFCPRCASRRLIPGLFTDPMGGEQIYEIVCAECGLQHRAPANPRTPDLRKPS